MKGLFTILVMLILISGMISPVYAPTPGTLYGVEGNGSPGTPGGLNIVDQTDGSLTLVGDVVTPGGLSGLAIDSTVTAFGTTVQGSGVASNLVIINLDTGNLVNTVGTVTDVSGQELKIGDLTIQPGTDVLFGITANQGPVGAPPGGSLFTISNIDGSATLVGDTGISTNAGLGFAPDGTLYMLETSPSNLHTVDPTNAQILTSVAVADNWDGLCVRADGTIFATQVGFFVGPFDLATVNPSTGDLFLIGSHDASLSDCDFVPEEQDVVGGEFLPIDSTALVLAGLQTSAIWMLPVLAGVAGSAFGILYIKYRRN